MKFRQAIPPIIAFLLLPLIASILISIAFPAIFIYMHLTPIEITLLYASSVIGVSWSFDLFLWSAEKTEEATTVQKMPKLMPKKPKIIIYRSPTLVISWVIGFVSLFFFTECTISLYMISPDLSIVMLLIAVLSLSLSIFNSLSTKKGFKSLGQKMDEGFKGLGQKMDKMSTKMDKMSTKMDKMSEILTEIRDALVKRRKSERRRRRKR